MPPNTTSPFNPEFDDTAWTDAWRHVPIAQVPPGLHPSGYRVERHLLETVDIFGQAYRFTTPFDCRLLFDPHGVLWMSTTPQEHIMMVNNARRSRGHVLVGGLGLGLYPQYAAEGRIGAASRFTVIEASPVVADIVAPTVSAALEVPIDVQIGDLDAFLAGPVTDRYDTIFLDTWDNLDPVYLPGINWLRDEALRHLAPGGTVLLWGYRWIVQLFEDACAHLLSVAPAERAAWLESQAHPGPGAIDLLEPVLAEFAGQTVTDLDAALAWCRRYITTRTTPIA